ncbi:coiled-coil domain-containing protein 102A [Microplitis demolitor]|uniref:coiled-coil domain-containing protein 102A n=1 Tax=Microplitis demolitor TaxID=69319 RepID=UPI0004CD3817|nr:coiled-coil domain-containing protein 102A [Microplitis demolitor]XP_053595799.1 coiled-coil domain-containing protein 102A [Microplitis demolitor]
MAQSTASGTSSRRHIKDHDISTNTRLPHYGDSEWETREALRQRELEEARARAAQMEKTMRWWSDCTANWREKWSKVRNERNKAREEAKLLRTKLEIAVKDANSYKHESQELEHQNEQLRKEMEKIHMVLLKHAGQFDRQIVNIIESDPQLRNSLGIDDLLELYNNVDRCDKTSPSNCRKSPRDDSCQDSKCESTDRDIEEYVLQGAVPKHAVELYKEGSMSSLERDIAKLMDDNNKIPDRIDLKSTINDDDDPLQVHMAMFNLGLEDSKNNELSGNQTLEQLRLEVIQLRSRCDELQKSRADVIKELSDLKEQYQIELMAAQADLLDEAANREGMDQRLNELRGELERLQSENAAEWAKRERLETEKSSLERENKQLVNEMREMQDRVDSRRSRGSLLDGDTRQLQQDLLDMKHLNAKLKKALNEKTTELTHALRRSEQYETEVKRVRARVEELKKELACAQDEVDAATNTVRKLQRNNENLIEQLESANVQIEHFKNSSSEPCAADVVAEILDDKLRDDDNDDSPIDFRSKRI